MSVETWGLMPKSQDDDETIEEAINRITQDHDDDANSHLDTGQALQSHKASEIIDHAAGSIVEDKIKKLNVSADHFKLDRLQFEFSFGSLDGWTQSKTLSAAIQIYLGSTYFSTGNTSGSKAEIYSEAYSEGWGVRFDKNPKIMFCVGLFGSEDQEIYYIAGSNSSNGFGFKVVGSTLYSIHIKNSVEYTTEIDTIPASWDFWRLKAVYTSGLKIEFYIDDELVATHSSNLPEDGDDALDQLEWFIISIENSVASRKTMYLRNLLFNQDY